MRIKYDNGYGYLFCFFLCINLIILTCDSLMRLIKHFEKPVKNCLYFNYNYFSNIHILATIYISLYKYNAISSSIPFVYLFYFTLIYLAVSVGASVWANFI